MKNSVFGPAPGVAGANRSPQSPSIVIGPPRGLLSSPWNAPVRRVVGVDAAVAEVADEDVAAEGAEGGRRERHRPGRVELAAADEPLQQVAVGREDVDEAVAGPCVVVVLAGALLGEGDVEVAADVVDPERGEAGGDRRVGEAVDEVEVAVEDVDPAEAEARRVDELAARRRHEGEALVVGADVARAVGRGRAVDGDHCVRVVDVRVPAGDRPVLGREQEEGGAGDAVLRDHEVGRARVEGVERLPGRRPDRAAAGRRRRGNRDDARLRVAGAVVERRHAGVVVGDPDRAARADRGAPRVLQVRIRVRGQPRDVRDEVRLHVRAGGDAAAVGGGRSGGTEKAAPPEIATSAASATTERGAS